MRVVSPVLGDPQSSSPCQETGTRASDTFDATLFARLLAEETALIAWPAFIFEMESRSINGWQHRLKREHPTCTERTKALIEECGWKGGDSGDSAGKKQPDQQIPKRIPLTPTGLMEGDCTRYES